MLAIIRSRLLVYKTDIIRCCNSHTSFTKAMSEAIENKPKPAAKKAKLEHIYKSRYNGRFKKRSWVDYSTDTNKEKPMDFNPEDRVKRKKCCILLGYSGVNYYGMQRNPEMKTIEEDLLVAMLKNKWISEQGFNQAQTIQFQRAARTDKGVSAARQCVSLKLPDDVNMEKLNNDLPKQIHVFCVKRVTKGFNSKDKCDARTYTYTIPTVAFAHHQEVVDMESYRVSSEKLNTLKELLKMFEGTKNFHNFTSKKEYLDPSSKRYIISFECGPPFIGQDNVEFTVLKVKGQSFMLHQIRKMIGIVLAVIRELTTPDIITRSFTEIRLDIPMAPGLGLVLDQVHYDRYNNRYGSDGIHDALTWTNEEPEIQKFMNEFIFPTIVDTEITEKSMVCWLETLEFHSYDVRLDTKPIAEDSENSGKELQENIV